MPIEDISKTSLHPGVANTNRTEENRAHKKIEKDEHLVQSKLDSVDISKEARELEQTIASLKSSLSELPDVRAAKMEEVKANFKNAFYDRPEVIEQVAKKVIDAFSIKK
jgi:glutamyl-tRNA reductase